MNFGIVHWSDYAHSDPDPFSIMDADADLEPRRSKQGHMAEVGILCMQIVNMNKVNLVI